MESFFTTFTLIFLAELGDKTQLAVMALSARKPWTKVLAGAFAAFFVLNLIAVAAGRLLGAALDPQVVKLAAGVVFLGFGVWTFMSKEEEDDPDGDEGNRAGRSAALASFVMIFLAELGDKTQFATTGLAARFDSPIAVFAGSTLALWAVSAIGALLGDRVVGKLPERAVRIVSGSLFTIFGAAMLYSAL